VWVKGRGQRYFFYFFLNWASPQSHVSDVSYIKSKGPFKYYITPPGGGGFSRSVRWVLEGGGGGVSQSVI
jgi:hypothetical protein